MESKFRWAHGHSSNNRNELLASDVCGCFYCLETFRPDQIKDWIDSKNVIALCPYCGIDSVIGSLSGLGIFTMPGFGLSLDRGIKGLRYTYRKIGNLNEKKCLVILEIQNARYL